MYKIYQVEYGDTIEKIAEKTYTTSENIKNINGINGDMELVVGSLIIVPNENEKMFENYRVKQGDTIYSISRLYNVDPDTLLMLNGLNKNDYIYPNQEIMIPVKDVALYITKPGDTINEIVNKLNTSFDNINKQNKRIFVTEDQLIVTKKEEI